MQYVPHREYVWISFFGFLIVVFLHMSKLLKVVKNHTVTRVLRCHLYFVGNRKCFLNNKGFAVTAVGILY